MKNSIHYKRISAEDSRNNTKEDRQRLLEQQEAEYFASGGKVRRIPTGVSGNPDFGVHKNKAAMIREAKRQEANG